VRRDRLVAVGTIAAITVLAWIQLLRIAGDMSGIQRDHAAAMNAGTAAMHAAGGAMDGSGVMDGAAGALAMPYTQPWGGAELAVAFVMWSVMMVAMMTPSAAPMLLMYDRLSRTRPQHTARAAYGASGAFLGGYLIVWIGFSIAASALQGGLHAAGLLMAGAERAAPAVGGALLLVVGGWQWTAARQACLAKCRSPLDFLMTEWRDGTAGALAMGLRHGAWCVGCCWALMLVLFAAGIMNLLWVAALAGWVLLEKTLPAGNRLGRAGAVLAIGWGFWLIAQAVLASMP
jgi:predicted metal-binding membrane protein